MVPSKDVFQGRDVFQSIKEKIDFRLDARTEYETRVVSKKRVLDIGGRNSYSKSRKRINLLNKNSNNTVISTDIVADYSPDLVDDICNTKIEHHSFNGIYCDAILEHVQEYWKAIDNIYNILEEEGEAFFYVPFFWSFHDLVDYHRFTFTEVVRMLDKFSDIKVFLPGSPQGFGSVFWYILTMTTIIKFPLMFRILSQITNSFLYLLLSVIYELNKKKIQGRLNNISREDFCFYYIYLFINHGFCAWVKK